MFTAIFACASVAQGELSNEYLADWYGDAGSSYYGWDNFSQANNAPNFNESGTPYGAQLFNFGAPAVITGGGNIYGMAGPLNIHVYGSGDVDAAILNMSFMGTMMDLDNVYMAANFADGSGSYISAAEMFEMEYNEIPGMGVDAEYAFEFDLSGFDQEVVEWGFIFESLGAHTSLDAVSVQTFVAAIPAPGALVLLGLAGCSPRRRRTA